jgi:GNAT superfamily N-acetyltransferase
MSVSIRSAQTTDAVECGGIIYAAFATIAAAHNFPPDFPSAKVATGVASMLIAHPGFYGVVAWSDGRIFGSNFLDERSVIGGVGPITIEPAVQNKGIGRQLMQTIIERAAATKMLGLRLVQDAYHNRSLCLYTRLGFVTREPLSLMQGAPLKLQLRATRCGRRRRLISPLAMQCAGACTASIAAPSWRTPSCAIQPPWSGILAASPATLPRSACSLMQSAKATKI